MHTPTSCPEADQSRSDQSAAADQTIDITGEVCPMTFVRTKLRLERMRSGEILSVRLRGEEPLRNVPKAARDEGHSILWIIPEGNDHIVTIRRA